MIRPQATHPIRHRATRFRVVTLLLTTALWSIAGWVGATEPEEAESAKEAAAGTVTKTLKWATASEVDNFGYDVYRSEHPDGPFERRTTEPVLGAGTTDEPSYYQWVDEGLDPSKDYFYYVESISIHDERERFTPIIKVEAKTGSDGSAEGSSGDSEANDTEGTGGDG